MIRYDNQKKKKKKKKKKKRPLTYDRVDSYYTTRQNIFLWYTSTFANVSAATFKDYLKTFKRVSLNIGDTCW